MAINTDCKIIEHLDPDIMLRLSPRLIEYYEKLSL